MMCFVCTVCPIYKTDTTADLLQATTALHHLYQLRTLSARVSWFIRSDMCTGGSRAYDASNKRRTQNSLVLALCCAYTQTKACTTTLLYKCMRTFTYTHTISWQTRKNKMFLFSPQQKKTHMGYVRSCDFSTDLWQILAFLFSLL